MTNTLAASLRRLAGAAPAGRRAQASALARRDIRWEDLLPAFNALHVESPELEALAAPALAAAVGRRRDATLAARLRLLEGRALQRSGSPRASVRAFRRAARELREVGDDDLALQADVLCVDALALAGRTPEALHLADATEARIRGPRARLWKGALAINRGNALRLRGDLNDAVLAYERAARVLDRAGDAHTAAIARTNAGVARMDGGDARGARTRFAEALTAFEAAGQTDMAREVRYNLAGALVREGRAGEGLAALELLVEEHEERGLDRRAALCRMDLADALLRAGDRRAAEEQAVAAAHAFLRSGAHAERVEALWCAASAAAREAPRRSRSYLRRASAAADRTDRPGLAMRCELLSADLAFRSGRAVDVASLRRILRRAEKLGQGALAAETRILLGHLALERSRPRDALRHFADPSIRRPGRPWIRAAADTGRALAEADLGQEGRAIARLRRVCDFLDAVRTALPGAWLRTTFVVERLDPYLARVALLLGRDRAEDRREAADVLDALALRLFEERTTPGPGDEALDALRRRLTAIHDRLARGDGATRGATRGADARQQLAWEKQARRLERDIADRWRKDERAARPGPAVSTARPAGAPPARDVTAVYVWVRDGRVYGLVRGSSAPDRAVVLAHVSDLKDRLSLLAFHDARSARSDAGREALRFGLENLAARVVLPLAVAKWRSRVRLVVAPDVPDLPWELLPIGGRPLAATCELLRVPALGLRVRRRMRGRGSVVVGLGPHDLPGTLDEMTELSSDARVLSGPLATRAALATALVEYDLVHVAGHGFDAPEAPPLGGVRVADGWFTAADVPARIGARTVVLAACRTGLVHGVPGRAWGGLPSALLAAGARAVLWTADDVEDCVTADLMRRFHRARRGATVPRALGLALERTWNARGHAGGLLPFRISGVGS